MDVIAYPYVSKSEVRILLEEKVTILLSATLQKIPEPVEVSLLKSEEVDELTWPIPRMKQAEEAVKMEKILTSLYFKDLLF